LKHGWTNTRAEWLFVGKSGKLSSRAVQKMLKKYAYQAGLPSEAIHPHILRHYETRNIMERGIPKIA
jgi:site-specific recombinase XerD